MHVFRFGGPWFKQFMPSTPYGDFNPKEIRDLIALWAIQQEEDGLTGYTISSYFGIPLTNVYRILDKFVDDKLLKTEETIKDGRAQKLYSITQKGKDYLNKLQEDWAGKVSFLANNVTGFCAPFPFRKKHHPHFERQIQKIEDQEDALKFLKVYQDSFNDRIESMELTINTLREAKNRINEAVQKVKNQNEFSSEIFVEIVTGIYEDIESEIRSTLHSHRRHP